MSIAPGGQLAACVDDRGRVFLLDIGDMCIIRAWKGYRSAQCAWLWAAELPRILTEQMLCTVTADGLEGVTDEAVDMQTWDKSLAPLQR
jgi:Rab3 GTPase-activating protein regulatory subunit N-terminus